MAKTDRSQKPTWLRFSGIGMEFVAAVVGFSLLGLWIDSKYDSSPLWLLIGAGLGLVGGTYNLIRESLAAFKPPTDGKRTDDPSKS